MTLKVTGNQYGRLSQRQLGFFLIFLLCSQAASNSNMLYWPLHMTRRGT